MRHLRQAFMPLRQRPSPNASRNRRIPAASCAAPAPSAPSEPIHATLRDLRPLRENIVAPGSDDAQMFDDLLAHEHYLGHRTTVDDLPAALRRRQGTSATSCGIGKGDPLLSSSLLPSTHTSAENPSLHCYPSWANVPGTHADGMPG